MDHSVRAAFFIDVLCVSYTTWPPLRLADTAYWAFWNKIKETYHAIPLIFDRFDKLPEFAERFAYDLFVIGLGTADKFELEDLQTFCERSLGVA